MRLLNLGKKSIKWSIFATNEQTETNDMRSDDGQGSVSDRRFDAYVLPLSSYPPHRNYKA